MWLEELQIKKRKHEQNKQTNKSQTKFKTKTNKSKQNANQTNKQQQQTNWTQTVTPQRLSSILFWYETHKPVSGMGMGLVWEWDPCKSVNQFRGVSNGFVQRLVGEGGRELLGNDPNLLYMYCTSFKGIIIIFCTKIILI